MAATAALSAAIVGDLLAGGGPESLAFIAELVIATGAAALIEPLNPPFQQDPEIHPARVRSSHPTMPKALFRSSAVHGSRRVLGPAAANVRRIG
jgi:hypothetical protein